MSDVERIVPPIPTLPPPVGRNVGDRRRRPDEHRERSRRGGDSPPGSPDRNPPDHIDEYA